MEEKLTAIAYKVAAYEGKRDSQSLQQLAKKYMLDSINYISKEGYFEAAANEKALGFDIFASNPQYKQLQESSREVLVCELTRNLFTGAVIRYLGVKHTRTKQVISIGFNLEAMKKINEMTMEQVEAM